MIKDWTELARLTAGADIIIERVRLEKSGIAIEGEFSLPPLAQLSSDDQVFIMAFVGAHGSIKDMERAKRNRAGRKAKQAEAAYWEHRAQHNGQ